jgi:Ca2+-binding EF-hand superfamily protein
MKKILMGGVAAAAIFAAGAAFASTATTQPAPAAHGHRAHAAMPTTRAEVQTHVAATFAKLDANHDGFVTKDELNAVDAKRDQKIEQRVAHFDPSKMFDRLDANHDGQITKAEAEAAQSQHAKGKGGQPAEAHATAMGRLFARADADKNGVITRAEFDAMGQQMKARMEHAGLRRDAMAGHMFDGADANKDGRVTLTEMQQAALAHFDKADTNRDGTISPQERQALRAQHKPS